MSSRASPGLVAHRVSTAVLERLGPRPARATVVARSATVVHVDMDGFVISLTGPRTPLMANGIAIAGPLASAVAGAVGERVWVGHGFVRGLGGAVTWDAGSPPEWDPRLPPWQRPLNAALARDVRRRLEAAGALTRTAEPAGGEPPAASIAALLRAVSDRRPESAGIAAAQLLGRGPGLTPVGDDLLAGAAATVATIGEAAGFGERPRRAWLRALTPPDLRRWTTGLSATLLELAIEGRAVEPLHALLDPSHVPSSRRDAVMPRLLGFGATTGRAYAFSAGACARRLARGGRLPR